MSFIYKNKTSTTYPLYETTRHFILIKNDFCEYNLPYPQSRYDLKNYPNELNIFGWYCILEYKISNCLLLGNYKAWHFYTKIIFALRNALASEMSHFPKIFCLMYGIWFPKERTLFLHFNGSEGYFTLCCKCWKLGVLFTFLQLKQKAVVIFTQHGDSSMGEGAYLSVARSDPLSCSQAVVNLWLYMGPKAVLF